MREFLAFSADSGFSLLASDKRMVPRWEIAESVTQRGEPKAKAARLTPRAAEDMPIGPGGARVVYKSSAGWVADEQFDMAGVLT